MDQLIQFIFEHAIYAHWVIFSILVIGGFNLPVSEDLLIIIGGVLAATLVPENTYKLYLCIFSGAYLSDSITYWIGRKLGPKLWKIKWFSEWIRWEKIEKMKQYYKKYGIYTLFVGRFIPFGGRNCLFLSAGLGKMHYGKFLIWDSLACTLSNSFLFWTAYSFGKNYEVLVAALKKFNIFLFAAFLIAIISYLWYKGRKTAAS